MPYSVEFPLPLWRPALFRRERVVSTRSAAALFRGARALFAAAPATRFALRFWEYLARASNTCPAAAHLVQSAVYVPRTHRRARSKVEYDARL